VEDKYKDAKDFLQATREGLSTEDEKMPVSTISEKVYQKCPFFDIINQIMKDFVSIILPYVGESGNFENISDLLFTDSTLRGDFESVEEDDVAEDNGPKDEVQADAGKEYEEEDISQRIASFDIPNNQPSSPLHHPSNIHRRHSSPSSHLDSPHSQSNSPHQHPNDLEGLPFHSHRM
jgi:hypothetical protein